MYDFAHLKEIAVVSNENGKGTRPLHWLHSFSKVLSMAQSQSVLLCCLPF